MRRTWFWSMVLAGVAATAALAQVGEVYCGSFTPMRIRVASGGKTPDQRAVMAMNVINKYLGGRVGRVATRPFGKDIMVFLNGERVVTVTPADAKAEKSKSPAVLAAKWARNLSSAFEQSKALK